MSGAECGRSSLALTGTHKKNVSNPQTVVITSHKNTNQEKEQTLFSFHSCPHSSYFFSPFFYKKNTLSKVTSLTFHTYYLHTGNTLPTYTVTGEARRILHHSLARPAEAALGISARFTRGQKKGLFFSLSSPPPLWSSSFHALTLLQA